MLGTISMLLLIVLMFPYLFNLYWIFRGTKKIRTVSSQLTIKIMNLFIFIGTLILGMTISLLFIYVLKLESEMSVQKYTIIGVCFSYNIAYIFYEFYHFIKNIWEFVTELFEKDDDDDGDEDDEDVTKEYKKIVNDDNYKED